jgi:hypothetical protein
MNKSVIIFDEPDLEFRFGQRVKDPHDGLGLFGPFDTDSESRPASVRYIAVGTPEGLTQLNDWFAAINQPIVEVPKNNYRLWPPFPGFEAAFSCILPQKPVASFPIDRDKVINASRERQPNERAKDVVNFYLEALRTVGKLDEHIDVAICVVPDEVWQNCRSQSHVLNPVGEQLPGFMLRGLRAGQPDIFGQFNPETYQLSPDFRRQLKARSMEFGIPLQIIRESTLRLSSENKRGKRGLTPLSDRMWNMSTTLYYKGGGKPWRLVSAREGVCYIGLAFRRTDLRDIGKTACCAAQMFLNTGDGIVFLGSFGPWYSPKTKQFQLDKSAASNLLEGVLETYRQLNGQNLTEIFLHSRSNISAEEFEGYQKACPKNVKLVGVRVRPDSGPRLFRGGDMPVLRGTFLRINERTGYLWGSGFKPRLRTYDGWETPVPLRIDVQHGDAAVERVAQDIFALTKLNYNSCRLGDSQPVTVGFSDAVGEILISNPTVKHRKPNFKFYI